MIKINKIKKKKKGCYVDDDKFNKKKIIRIILFLHSFILKF